MKNALKKFFYLNLIKFINYNKFSETKIDLFLKFTYYD